MEEKEGKREEQTTSWKQEEIVETDEKTKAKNSVDLGDFNNKGDSEKFSESRSVSQDEFENSSIFSIPKRYVLAIMMFAGFMNMYAIRVNLNVAIGAMVKPHPVVENGKHYIKVIRFFIKFDTLIKNAKLPQLETWKYSKM